MNARARIVVTGGTGLLGRALVERLAAGAFDVVVLSRRPDRSAGIPAAARLIGWDGRSATGWAHEVDGAAAIVNLAGEPIASGRWTAARRRRILESRREACGALLEAVRAARVKPEVLLQASAVGFYGDRADAWLDEAIPAGEGFLAETTTLWEGASVPIAALGVRRVLLRTGVVLAREGGALPKLLLPLRLGLGGKLGAGRQWVPWIHVADEIAAILFLLDRTECAGAFNLVAPAPVTNAELTRIAAARLRRPNVLAVPAWALRAVLGELSQVVLASQRVRPARLLEMGFEFRYPVLGAALDELLG